MSDITLYDFGTKIKNNTHQIITKKAINKEIITFFKRIQLRTKINNPKLIIDHGLHQKGFEFQNFCFESDSIKSSIQIP